MINREDMLELTRRMTIARTSFTRTAGCYVDADGDFDGSFNVNFLNLSGAEKTKNLAIAKAIPFAETNRNLRKYRYGTDGTADRGMRQLLLGLRECGLKNDALMDSFYDLIMERYQGRGPYAVQMFHDRYDVAVKAADKQRLWESEEVYDYLICAVCPLIGEYEPGPPVCGFLFPAFTDRSTDLEHVNVFQADASSHPEFAAKVLGCRQPGRNGKRFE